MSGKTLKLGYQIEKRILVIRGSKVMVDADLAHLYGVSTKRLNEQVKGNADRFPPDFMFQLTPEEKSEVVANCDHLKNIKYSLTFLMHSPSTGRSCLQTSSKVGGQSMLVLKWSVLSYTCGN